MDKNGSESKKSVVMSPLADPVVNAMFADKETAGLAIVSLINAVLEEDGETIQIEKIISVTPQRQHSGLGQRGCRIDIEVVAKNKERVIVEVQMSPESWIMQRNLFSASRIFTETSVPGDTSKEMAARLPRIIVINIINYLLRVDNTDMMQPAKIMFTKKPHLVAVPNLTIYNVQLPAIMGMKENFDYSWYCWFYALYKADSENKTLEEVIEMTPQLQAYSKKDAGFRQYCEQYGRVSSDPETREDYYDWIEALMKEAGMKHAAEEIARREAKREADEAKREADEKWQATVAEKDAVLAEKDAVLAEKDAVLAEKDAVLAEKDALIAELRAKLGDNK